MCFNIFVIVDFSVTKEECFIKEHGLIAGIRQVIHLEPLKAHERLVVIGDGGIIGTSVADRIA